MRLPRRLALGFAGVSLLACFDSKRIIFTDSFANEAGLDAGVAAVADPMIALDPFGVPSPGSGVAAEGPPAALDVPLDDVSMAVPGEGSSPAPPPDAGTEPALPGVVDCTPPSAAPGAVLFSGVPTAGACPTTLDPPYATTWFSYQDSGAALALATVTPGCAPDACALRVDGPPPGVVGYSAFGAGVALPLSTGAPLDARGFSGFQFWARGSLTGTRGPGAVDAPQTLFAKLVTSTNRQGDDFGVYCRIDPSAWTLCSGEFGSLVRDGFAAAPDPASDVLDLQNALRLEVEFRLYRDLLGAVPVPVSVAVELASISFF